MIRGNLNPTTQEGGASLPCVVVFSLRLLFTLFRWFNFLFFCAKMEGVYAQIFWEQLRSLLVYPVQIDWINELGTSRSHKSTSAIFFSLSAHQEPFLFYWLAVTVCTLLAVQSYHTHPSTKEKHNQINAGAKGEMPQTCLVDESSALLYGQ